MDNMGFYQDVPQYGSFSPFLLNGTKPWMQEELFMPCSWTYQRLSTGWTMEYFYINYGLLDLANLLLNGSRATLMVDPSLQPLSMCCLHPNLSHQECPKALCLVLYFLCCMSATYLALSLPRPVTCSLMTACYITVSALQQYFISYHVVPCKLMLTRPKFGPTSGAPPSMQASRPI